MAFLWRSECLEFKVSKREAEQRLEREMHIPMFWNHMCVNS